MMPTPGLPKGSGIRTSMDVPEPPVRTLVRRRQIWLQVQPSFGSVGSVMGGIARHGRLNAEHRSCCFCHYPSAGFRPAWAARTTVSNNCPSPFEFCYTSYLLVRSNKLCAYRFHALFVIQPCPLVSVTRRESVNEMSPSAAALPTGYGTLGGDLTKENAASRTTYPRTHAPTTYHSVKMGEATYCREAVSSGELLTIAHSGICLVAFDSNKCKPAEALKVRCMELVIASYGDSAWLPRGVVREQSPAQPDGINWVPSILAPLQGCDERKLIQPILRTGRCERKTTRSTGFCIWLLACGMPPFQPRTNIENEYRGDYCLFARNLRDPTAPLVIFSAYVPSHNRVPFIQPEPSNKAEEVADVHHSCPPIFPRLSP
ncbi:hypothetical protein M419DRAFT_39440 [Trichoderma reesei RUT C-30]|uniref:Uncharacterized protein n=1 Tax=Hypocrea jecorina (strain ATCC 56765 / BCRC 32924 / NRRL 11460 / Rut C-30) TaxID=1344414 RepID=A0A024RX41_HYPJR|nr:hypothetical protein M419DRAFT_39440 [Trichoderma reesei RUT C-30]